MTTGNKLAKLRKEAGYTQEQLAEMLDVSRQSISKWESDAAYPETEKLIKLGELYGCSMDYLLKDGVEEKDGKSAAEQRPSLSKFYFERKSEKTVRGVPLWHINVGLGRTARGIFAVGLCAKGIVSVGVLSMGILSLGALSLGVIAFGAFSLGVLALGAICAGIIALGAISLGIISTGAVAIGLFSAGALAIGKYFAMGDYAFGDISLGITKMVAKKWGVAPFHGEDLAKASQMLDKIVPRWLGWAKKIIQWFLG